MFKILKTTLYKAIKKAEETELEENEYCFDACPRTKVRKKKNRAINLDNYT